nr:ras-related protein Rab-26 isoform X2 [Manis javanica]
MSRKKTPKGKGASAPAASALPAANGPRPALPGTARPGPGTPHNAPPQPGRPPVGSGGDFYDVAFKVSRPHTPHERSRWCPGRAKRGRGPGRCAVPCGPPAQSRRKQHHAAVTADTVHRAHAQLSDPGSGCPASGKACPWPLPPAGRTNKGSRVMLVGDSGVGKTCLLVRFKDGAFLAGTFISTVGIDFRNKVLDVDGMKVKLQIWDTAGQERFRSVTHAYYRDAHALLLLYDVTNKASFDNIQAWLAEIQEYAQHDVVLMLLGNKVDSAQERVVKREDGEKLAKFLSMAQDPTSVPRRWHCPSSTNTQPSWQRKNRRAVWNPNTVEDTREPRWLKTKTRTTRSGSQ